MRFHRDAVGVDLRTARECVLDLPLDLGRRRTGFNWIKSVTPFTPLIRRTACSARSR